MSASDLDRVASDADVAYASFAARLRAWIIDTAIVAGISITVLLGSDALPAFEHSGRAALFLTLAFLMLYEPVLVSRFGATVGHRVSNIRVVADRSGANPSFRRAVARFFIKAVLGLYSFITMAVTRRHQAVHDSLTATTVQIRDLSRARPGDMEFARTAATEASIPNKWRRLGVTLVYEATLFLIVSVFSGLAVSFECIDHDACTSQEDLLLNAAGLVWIAAAIYVIIAGWRGRLWGARSTRSSLDIQGQLPTP